MMMFSLVGYQLLCPGDPGLRPDEGTGIPIGKSALIYICIFVLIFLSFMNTDFGTAFNEDLIRLITWVLCRHR